MTNVRTHTLLIVWRYVYFQRRPSNLLDEKKFSYFNWLALAWKLNFID